VPALPPNAAAVTGGYMAVGRWYQTSSYGTVTINVPVTLCSTGGSAVRVNPADELALFGTPDVTGSVGAGFGPGPDANAPIVAAPSSCANGVVGFEYWDFGTNGNPRTLELVDPITSVPYTSWTFNQ